MSHTTSQTHFVSAKKLSARSELYKRDSPPVTALHIHNALFFPMGRPMQMQRDFPDYCINPPHRSCNEELWFGQSKGKKASESSETYSNLRFKINRKVPYALESLGIPGQVSTQARTSEVHMPCWQWAHLISDDLRTQKFSWDWLKVPLIGSNNKGAPNKQQMYIFFPPLEVTPLNRIIIKRTPHHLHCGQDHTQDKKPKPEQQFQWTRKHGYYLNITRKINTWKNKSLLSQQR